MHRRLLTVTLNPSIDLTLWLDGLHPDKANRVIDEIREAGGKGINVSRVVRSFGVDSLCLAVAGQENSREFAAFLEQDRLRYELFRVEGSVRENLTLRYDDQTVKLNRKGPDLSDRMIGAIMTMVRGYVRAGDVVVFAGSLPENMSIQDYVEIILSVKEAGALVALDTDVLTLEDYRRIKPWLIKPNIHETENIIPLEGTTIPDIVKAGAQLHDLGVENAVISLGGDGLVCVSGEGAFYAAVPSVEVKSTVGAGDSALAGFIVQFIRGGSLPDCVRMAAACGSDATMKDGSRVAEKETATLLLDSIRVEKQLLPG